MINRLAAQKAVFRRDIALDIDKAQHPLGMGVRQHQRGEPTHRMTDQMKTGEAELIDHRQRGFYQQRNRNFLQIGTAGFSAPRRIVGQKWPVVKGCVAHDIGVVLFGGTEAVKENDRLTRAGTVNGGNLNVGALYGDGLLQAVKFAGHKNPMDKFKGDDIHLLSLICKIVLR